MDKYPYIRTLLKIRLEIIQDVKTIIDVGAYLGEFLKDLSQGWPQSTIHAIEPLHDCAVRIKELNCSNVIIHEMAISNRNGRENFHYELKEKPTASGSIFETDTGLKKEVPCMTFASFCDTNKIEDIDLLLINAEGAEYLMFEDEASREKILRSKIVDLSMHGKNFFFNTKEYAQKRLDINNFMISSGYKIIYGDAITGLSLAPRHVRQVWIRDGAR